MQLVQSGKVCSFEVTYQSGLDVGMSVYDDSGGSPSLVGSITTMDFVIGGTYRAKFTPSANKTYLIIKAVYTDGTLTTLHPDYNASSESIRSEDLLGAAVAGFPRAAALANYGFMMTDNIFHQPAEELDVMVQILKDGGDWEDSINDAEEVAHGYYRIDLDATEMDGKIIALRYKAPGADTRMSVLVTAG